MSVAEWTDTYGIYHWRIIWSCYRKLAWVVCEPRTTEFCSNALTDWAIRPWAQFALRATFVQLREFHRLFSVQFHFGYCLPQSPRLFSFKFSWGNQMSKNQLSILIQYEHWTLKQSMILICFRKNKQQLFYYSEFHVSHDLQEK